MRTSISFLLFIFTLPILNAQPCSTPAQNLQKYWEYRERLKDFVVVGRDSGCSLISTNRSSGQLNYNDEPTPLGYYIGVLASEYYLLDTQANDTASYNQKQRTLEELYYALKAAVRLDRNAEAYWRHYYALTTYSVSPSDLNGFMLRDDISSNFLTDWENGDYVDNDLNKGLSPPPNGKPTGPDYRADLLRTSFVSGVTTTGAGFEGSCIFENGKPGGPEPASKDELTQLFTGLAIVSRLLPLTSNQFYMGNNLTDTAIIIASRITSWMDIGAGYILNPITGDCSAGMDWGGDPNFWDQCKCDEGGANPGTLLGGRLLYGFLTATTAIGSNFNIPAPPVYSTMWSIVYKNFYMNNEEFMPLTLGTIGYSWGNVTGGVVNTMALEAQSVSDTFGDLDGLPLLFTVLWKENTASFTASYYNDLVSAAPCHGPVGYDGNYEWSTGERWIGGPNKKNSSYSDIFFGVDYMLYFNLLCVAYPTLTGIPSNKYTNYFYISAKHLRYPYLIETNCTESSEKNFAAADSIEAGNIDSAGNYTIANNAMYPSNAQVHFMAGKLIDLMPGFDAEQGITLFDAYIDTSIHAMNCSECDPSYNAEDSLPHGIILPLSLSIPWFSGDTIESCTHCDTIHFLGIEGDTLGVSHWHWDFGNGDTSNSSHPYVIYCLSGYVDTATEARDTTFQVTLITTDSASGENDTLVTSFYIYCPAGIPLHHPVSSNRDNTPVPNGSSGYFFTLQPSITNTSTSIQYTLPQQTQVDIRIYTMLGVNTEDIVNTVKNAGQYSVNFNTQNLPPGIYYVSMLTSNFTKTIKLVVVK